MSAESAIRMFFRHIFNQYMEMPFLIKFTTDQDYHCGAHISGRNKLRSLLPVIIERVADFLDRGAASGEFRSEINPEFFRSEEHTSELQSLMRISYAVFSL